jgi:hypothetical protein
MDRMKQARNTNHQRTEGTLPCWWGEILLLHFTRILSQVSPIFFFSCVQVNHHLCAVRAALDSTPISQVSPWEGKKPSPNSSPSSFA